MNLSKLEKLAKKLASKSTHYRYRMSAIVFKRSNILNVGWNCIKTHPRSNDPYHMIHAELSAILGLEEQDLDGASILVYRLRNNGSSGLARPCATCEAMLRNLGLSKVYYSTEKELKSYDL
jgi:deoxycytidylate deaminase